MQRKLSHQNSIQLPSSQANDNPLINISSSSSKHRASLQNQSIQQSKLTSSILQSAPSSPKQKSSFAKQPPNKLTKNFSTHSNLKLNIVSPQNQSTYGSSPNSSERLSQLQILNYLLQPDYENIEDVIKSEENLERSIKRQSLQNVSQLSLANTAASPYRSPQNLQLSQANLNEFSSICNSSNFIQVQQNENRFAMQNLMQPKNFNFERDMRTIKREILKESQQETDDDKLQNSHRSHQNQRNSPTSTKSKLQRRNYFSSADKFQPENKFSFDTLSTDPLQRLFQLKYHVLSSINIPESQYPGLVWKMKDFLLRKDGLTQIKQKQILEEKELSQQGRLIKQPEFKNFFRNEQVNIDLRDQIKIHQEFLEKKLRDELMNSLQDGGEKALFEACLQKINEEEEEKQKLLKKGKQKQNSVSKEEEEEQQILDQLSISIPPEYLNSVVKELLPNGVERSTFMTPPFKIDWDQFNYTKLLQQRRNQIKQQLKFQQQQLQKSQQQQSSQNQLSPSNEQINIENNQVLFKNSTSKKSIFAKLKNTMDKLTSEICPKSVNSNDPYWQLFKAIKWDKQTEDMFNQYRIESKKYTKNIGSRGAANQLACATFHNRNEELLKTVKLIQYDQQKEETPFYNLNANNQNIKMLQKEFNNISKSNINELELEVSKEILFKFNQIKNYVKKIRSEYFLQISQGIRHNIDIFNIQQEFKQKLLDRIKEQKFLAEKIRFLLTLEYKKKQKLTYMDKNFDKEQFFQEKLSKVDQFSKLRRELIQKNQSWEVNQKEKRCARDGIRGVSTTKINKKDSPIYNKKKCLKFYSGGPTYKKQFTKYDKNKAAIIIQREIRKYFGRKKLYLMKVQISQDNFIKKYAQQV